MQHTNNASMAHHYQQDVKFLPDVYDEHGEPVFMRHPDNFPIQFKRDWMASFRSGAQSPEQTSLGLCFESAKYLKPGTVLELSIPLRGETQKFRAHVVLVLQNKHKAYEIGCLMHSQEEAYRARIVEQICHIESYLQNRHLSRTASNENNAAQEWIENNASAFPV